MMKLSRKPKTCPTCQEKFLVRKNPAEVYCSPECKPKRSRVQRITKVCPGCHKEFQTTPGRDARCCSKKCRSRVWSWENPEAAAAKVREWEKANPDAHRIRQGERSDRRRRSVTGTVSTRDWLRALRRAEGRCWYCGERAPLTIEHVIPLSRGGMHTIGNVVPACPSCNYQKQHRTVMEWRMWKEKRYGWSRTSPEGPEHSTEAP
ncbi:HNH endonuclease [Gordonia phage GrootJr]|nr:HNH endonuclease [Gordonia phage NovumRegina]QOR55842.2 HNH endonuclease [Gordonia phage GrootJr]